MPRLPRLSTSGITYHVLNRRGGRLELFERPADYSAFEKILAEAHREKFLNQHEEFSLLETVEKEGVPL